MSATMTRDHFLARCATAFDMGLVTVESLGLLERWIDCVLRLEGGQLQYVATFLEAETERTNHFQRTLANDPGGYGLVRLAALLSHPCQQCATNPEAWHTRAAFCPHQGEGLKP